MRAATSTPRDATRTKTGRLIGGWRKAALRRRAAERGSARGLRRERRPRAAALPFQQPDEKRGDLPKQPEDGNGSADGSERLREHCTGERPRQTRFKT